MFKKSLLLAAVLILLSGVYAHASGKTLKLQINNNLKAIDFINSGGQIYVPLRLIAEGLGAQVQWDQLNNKVVIESPNTGDSYLKGEFNKNAAGSGISLNLINTSELKDILDDDDDNDLADYRDGHSGGDSRGNDPLLVDTRKRIDYENAHIPGAVWVAPAEKMGAQENMAALKQLLNDHAAKGGKKEIVVYCYTGNTSGLVTGVLGAQGLPVKNLMYGFDIGWRGTKTALRPIYAPMENESGEKLVCGG